MEFSQEHAGTAALGCPAERSSRYSFASAEEADIGIARNHGASHDEYNDHNRKLHFALTNRRCIDAAGLSLRRLPEKTSYSSVRDKFGVRVGKDLGGKSLDGCALTPSIQRQPGFAASLFQKILAVPSIFDGNLGQKQSATAAL
jgi:hypothetical protein